MPDDPAKQHSFPAGQVLQLAELAKRWQVKPSSLLGPFGLQEEQLARPGARVTLPTLIGVTERARTLTGEPGLGIYLGLQKHATAYGFVGFAAMSASTVGEALRQITEFSPTITTGVSLSLLVEGATAALVVREHVDLGSVRDIGLFSLMVGWQHMAREQTGREPLGTVEFAISRPHYFARFADVLPNCRFDQPVSQFIFPRVGLDLPLVRRDQAALNLARQQCQQQLDELGFDGSLPGRVRRALISDEGFRSVDEVASALALSERTLKRRLAEHGLSFSTLLQEERQLRALQLLRSTALSLDEVAERLGYSSVSSFSRAFTRWTDQTPGAYRRSLPASGVLLGD